MGLWTGFWIGVMSGGIFALVRGPRIQLTSLFVTFRDLVRKVRAAGRGTAEFMLPVDPIAEGIREGKSAVHERQRRRS